MRLEGRRGSKNIDDRRRGGSRGRTAGGIGIGTIILAIIVFFMGGNPLDVLSSGGGYSSPAPQTTDVIDDDPNKRIVEVTLAETEDTWNRIFREQYGRQYKEPVLVLFSGQDRSACGFASTATGPFYCPADQQVYIDLSFADQLRKRFRAPGDFALAYVVAHEVGHHIQNLLGYSQQVSQARRRMREKDANAMLVRLELQADYLAGVWAHYAARTDLLEEGDIKEALTAASAIGDDRIQMQTQGYVVPDSFTHGTSEQRVKAFYSGYESGDASKQALDFFFTTRSI